MSTHKKIFLLLVLLTGICRSQNAAADSTADSSASADEQAAQDAEEVGPNDEEVSAQAKAAFEEATELYGAGKYNEATQKFNDAYALKPAWKLLYNIGQAEAASKRQGLAIESFEKYLTEGGDEIPVERRDEVLKEIERLRLIVGAVALEAPDGYDVYVDGVARGTTPLIGKMRISASQEHVIELRDGENVLDSKSVQVAGQEVVEVQMGSGVAAKTTAGGSAAVVASNTLTPEQLNDIRRRKLLQQSKTLRIVGWTTLGVGGAMALLSVAGLAVAKKQKADNDKVDCSTEPDPVDCQTTLDKDVQDQKDLAGSSVGLLVLGVAAIITAPFLLHRSKRKARQAAAIQTAIVPVIGPTFGGLSLTTTF